MRKPNDVVVAVNIDTYSKLEGILNGILKGESTWSLYEKAISIKKQLGPKNHVVGL